MTIDANSVPSTGNPYVEAVRLFLRGVEFLDGLPFGASRIKNANRRAAIRAGYRPQDGYTSAQLQAIGQGLRSNFPTGDPVGPYPLRAIAAAPAPQPAPNAPGNVFEELLRKSWEPRGREEVLEELERLLKKTFTPKGRGPSIPDQMPKRVPIPQRVAVLLPGVLGTILSTVGLILFPSSIGKEPPWQPPPSTRKGKGPPRRPKVKAPKTRTAPRGLPPVVPKMPQYRVPSAPSPVRGQPSIDPKDYPIRIPQPAPVPAPGRIPAPKFSLGNLAPFALPAALFANLPSSNLGRRSARVAPAGRGLTRIQSTGLGLAPQPSDPCEAKRARERRNRKPSCTNPIVRTTKRTTDGQQFITITRRIECQASSRKKLR